MISLTKTMISAVRADNKLLPAFVMIAVLAALLIWRAGYNYHIAALGEIASKAEKYSAVESMIDRADEFRMLKEAYDEKVRVLESGFLSANKPSIGAARLQEAFRAMASKQGIAVTSQRALPAVYMDRYVRVPVEFQIKTGLPQLKELLYDIQASPVLMGVRYLRVKAPESGAPGSLEVTIVVEGAIGKQTGV